MSTQRRNQIARRGGTTRGRGGPSHTRREPPQGGTTRRGGHSAYARYPHEQFAADRAAEAAKTRIGSADRPRRS